MDIEKELQKQLLNEREALIFRQSYDREISFYTIISEGDLDALDVFFERVGKEDAKSRRGVLSDNDIANSRYHMIIMTALISRFCIEAGMDINVSYSLSDIFIRMIDKAKTVKEVNDLRRLIATEYCTRMRDGVKKAVVSRHIVLAIDYIRSNIRENLTVESIAYALSLNPSYLSKLFKQEMGKTLSRYIRDQKMEISRNMLRHLDESSLNIANYLGFSSQSHFIQVFKKENGMTPEEYRKKYYHQSWMSET
ncbi:MAG: helix-turn-helix transcriptional regulator [Clostridiales bacterium]|nr:helix-turn-helix transcriptional regulator [Clostridiales bacterium]